MTRILICILVTSLLANVIQSKEYSDQINQGYSVALPYGSPSSSPSSSPSASPLASPLAPVIPSTGADADLQSAAHYQQSSYSGPPVNSVASSIYANGGPIGVADQQQKNYNNYGPIQQQLPIQQQYLQSQPQQQQQQQHQYQPQQQQPQQSQPNYDQLQQQPIQNSPLNYGPSADSGDYNGVKSAPNVQGAPGPQGSPKKTVILAIPVKLALQLPENKGNYGDKQQAPQQQQQQQQSNLQQNNNYGLNNQAANRPYESTKNYGDNVNDQKTNEYRAQESPVYSSQSPYGQPSQSYDNSNLGSQAYSPPSSASPPSPPPSSPVSKASAYNRDSNQYDVQQKYDFKNNGPSSYNGNNPYVQMKEPDYNNNKPKSTQSNSYENQPDSGYSGKNIQNSENDGFDSYEGTKGGGDDSYKANNNNNQQNDNYGQSKDASYPSAPDSSSSYDDDNDDDPANYGKGPKGYQPNKPKYPTYTPDSDSNSYGKQKGNDYPSLTSSYDGDQDDWQSGYSGKSQGREKSGIKGANNLEYDLSSYSGDDSSSYSNDDSDSKSDTASLKAALANYGSLKGSGHESDSGSGGLKVINDYSALKDYEGMKELGSLSFGGGSKDYGSIKSLSDFGGSFKDLSTSMKHLSSLKDYASLTKERPKEIKLSGYDGSDSLDDYDSGSSPSGLSSYSSGADSSISSYSGLSSYDTSSLPLSSGSYSGSSGLTSLRPSKYSSSGLGSLGDSSYDSFSSGHSYGSSGLSSLSGDSSYELPSHSSSPSVSHASNSGSSYGSGDIFGSLTKMPGSSSYNPSTFTISDAVSAPEGISGYSSYSSPVSLSSSYLSPSGSSDASADAAAAAAAVAAVSSPSHGSGLPLSLQNSDGYGSSQPLDLSSLYGSAMKSYSSQLYAPRSPLTLTGSIYPQQNPPQVPMQVINAYATGPMQMQSPPYGVMFGKPNNKQHPPPPPSKYMSNGPRYRLFPSMSSPLSLYKGLQGSSSSAPSSKFSASSILSSLYSSGSSPAKFVLKTNGKGSGLLGSLRLASSSASSSLSSNKKPSSSTSSSPFTSPFKLDNIFGQIYKLL